MTSALYPPALKKGDTLGIVAPAGQMRDQEHFHSGVGILERMGFQVKYPPELWPGTGYLSDSDMNRGAEFNSMIRDNEINGLIALRGGYGCLRMLDHIDLELIAARPKLLVGFSDITVLQNFLFARIGLVSLHGPVVTSLASSTDDTLADLHDRLDSFPLPAMAGEKIDVLRHGPPVIAPIIGGNLASMVTLLGTPYDFSWDDKIVFLEDVNEPLYKIDRMLTQLSLARKLDRVAGLILGEFSSSSSCNQQAKLDYREAICRLVLELCPVTGAPIWGNFPSGHGARNFTFPLGATVEMNSSSRRLRLS